MSLAARIVKAFPVAGESGPFKLDIEFEAEGGVTVIFGASGAGKSLTLDAIAGFVRPTEGQITLDKRIFFDSATGVNIASQKRNIGYVFQNYALFPHMTVRENLAFAARRGPRLERHRRVQEMLDRFNLSDVAGRRPGEVSGGQRQRCSIARALVGAPQLLLCDEPSRGLDAGLRSDFYALLRELRATLGIPLLLVTHDLDEAVLLGDRMIVLQAGRIVQCGAPETVISRPVSPEVARLFGFTNVLTAEILALDPARNYSRVRLLGEPFASGTELIAPYLAGHLLRDRIQLMIRGDEIGLAAEAGENRIRARLRTRLEHARYSELHFENGLVAVTPRCATASLEIGNECFLHIPPASVRLPGVAHG